MIHQITEKLEVVSTQPVFKKNNNHGNRITKTGNIDYIRKLEENRKDGVQRMMGTR